MAAMVGSSGTGIYSKAISRSPVTDWRYYGEYNNYHTHCVLFMELILHGSAV